MKKTITRSETSKNVSTIILTCLTMILFTSASYAASYEIQGGAQFKRLPKGTQMNVKTTESVTTQDAGTGDSFSVTLLDNLKVDKTVVLPQGTLIRGNVEEVKQAKRLSRSAILYLNFDHIVTPSGRQLPIKAGLCSNFKLTKDGAITTGGGYLYALSNTWDTSVNIVKKSTQWGLDSGEKLFTGAQYILTPVAAVGGTVGAGAYLVVDSIADLFKKGNDVIINQGQEFSILLLEPLDVPIH